MKQTALEYLIEQLSNYDSPMMELFEKEINQAKEMEKQQIIDFSEKHILENLTCNYNGEPISLKEAEQYYNEKFNK